MTSRKGAKSDPAPSPTGAGSDEAPRKRKPEPLVGSGLGEIAYEAYRKAVDGTSVNGDALPTWVVQIENTPHVAAAWCAAAQAVITATIERTD